MKKKNREIQKPDLPQSLEPLSIKEIADHSSFELGRMETTVGPIHAKHVRFREIHVRNVVFEKTHLPFSSWIDVVFEKCDLSNADFSGAKLNRVEFIDCKMRGANFDHVVMRDVSWVNCQAPYSRFSLTELKDVRFENCFLSGSNFLDSSVDNLQLGTTTIDDVQFSGTSLKNVDLSECQYTYIHLREDDLRGAIVSPEQAISLIEVFGVKVNHHPISRGGL